MRKQTKKKVAIGAVALGLLALIWPKGAQATTTPGPVPNPNQPPAPPANPQTPPPPPVQPPAQQSGPPPTFPPEADLSVIVPPGSTIGGRAVLWQWFTPENEWRILTSIPVDVTDVTSLVNAEASIMATLPFYTSNPPPYQCVRFYVYSLGAWAPAGRYCNYT